jgi:hypothetical protein
MDSDNKITTSYVITQPTDIRIREAVGTELLQEKSLRNKVKGAAYVKVVWRCEQTNSLRHEVRSSIKMLINNLWGY